MHCGSARYWGNSSLTWSVSPSCDVFPRVFFWAPVDALSRARDCHGTGAGRARATANSASRYIAVGWVDVCTLVVNSRAHDIAENGVLWNIINYCNTHFLFPSTFYSFLSCFLNPSSKLFLSSARWCCKFSSRRQCSWITLHETDRDSYTTTFPERRIL